MTKVISPTFAEFSRIRYLVDPGQPANGPIPLGVVIEAVVGEQWFVGISTRSVLSRNEMTVLDGVARELLQNPFEYLKREVHAVLPSAQKPGDVLARLSDSRFWSTNVASPERWQGVQVLAMGSIEAQIVEAQIVEAQIKEQMSGLWFRIVCETLGLPAPRPPGRRRARRPAKSKRCRDKHFGVLDPGRFFAQDDYWRIPLRLAHSSAGTA